MSNYRVRQVMALGLRSRRDRDFLIGLATWMKDDSRTVAVSMSDLMPTTGLSHNTFREAHRALEADGSLKVERGTGRTRTTWTVLCLPERGTRTGPGRRTSSGPPGGPGSRIEGDQNPGSEAIEGDQWQVPDQQEVDRMLKKAKSSCSGGPDLPYDSETKALLDDIRMGKR